MKRLFLLVFLICLIPINTWSQCIEESSKCIEESSKVELARLSPAMIGSKPDYCSTCPDAAAGADVYCEDFELGDTNGICDWTIVEDVADPDDGKIDMVTCDNAPALGCTDIGMTYCMTATRTETDWGQAYIYKAYTQEYMYMQFYVKMITAPPSGYNSVIAGLMGGTVPDEDYIAHIQAYNSSGVLKFKMYWYDTGAHDVPGSTAITADTWYAVRLYVRNSSTAGQDAVDWWVDYNNDGDFDDAGEAETGATGKTFGSVNANVFFGIQSSNQQQGYQFSGIRIDDDAMPGGCTR